MRLADSHRSRAILIGTATYTDDEITNLPAVTNNVNDLADILTSPDLGGFNPEHCHALHNLKHSETRLVPKLAEQAEDVLLVYFAGHGLLNRDGELVLAMTDTEIRQPDFTGLSTALLKSAIRNSPAQTKVVMVDCCYSERMMRDWGATMASAQDAVEIPGSYVLASAGANQAAKAPIDQRYTAFTGELIALLRNGIANDREFISMDMVYHALLRRVTPSPKQFHGELAALYALVRNRGNVRAGRQRPAQGGEQRWTVLRNTVFDRGQDLNARMEAFDKLMGLASYVPDVMAELRHVASDDRVPLLLRIRCAYEIDALSDTPGAIAVLGSVVGENRARGALERIRAFVNSLDDGQAWYDAMAKAWDLWDFDLQNGSDQERWALLVAMLLAETGISVKRRISAARELLDLGRPDQARWVLTAMLRDTRLGQNGTDKIRSALQALP